MRPIVGGRRTQQFVSRQFVSMSVQFELRGAIELPDDDEMREALDVGEPRLKLGQDLEHAIGLVFSAKTLGNFACVLVRTTHKSNRPRGKHVGQCSVTHDFLMARLYAFVCFAENRPLRLGQQPKQWEVVISVATLTM